MVEIFVREWICIVEVKMLWQFVEALLQHDSLDSLDSGARIITEIKSQYQTEKHEYVLSSMADNRKVICVVMAD